MGGGGDTIPEFLKEIPPNKWRVIANTTINSFPVTFSGGLSHDYIACVKGYTTLKHTYTGNNYVSIMGIKADGTSTVLADGSRIGQASATYDVTNYDYVIYKDVESTAFNLTATLT